MVRCPQCGLANIAERRTCKRCGTDLAGAPYVPTEEPSAAFLIARLGCGCCLAIVVLSLLVVLVVALVVAPRLDSILETLGSVILQELQRGTPTPLPRSLQQL